MSRRVWWNGALVPPGDASVAVDAAAVQLGVMPYDTLRLHRRQPIHVQAHLDRFERSCRLLGIEPPMREDVMAAIDAVAAGADDACLLRVAAVPLAAATGAPDAADLVRLLVTMRPLPHVPPGGMRLVTAPFEAVPPRAWPHAAKVTGRATSAVAMAHARAAGAHEAVFQSSIAGYTEGTRTNLFVVHHNHLVTSPGSNGLLAGLTREWVLTEASGLGLVTHQMAVTHRDVVTADEVFVTGTGTGIAAVVELDGRTVGGGAPGPFVRRMQDAHRRHLDDAAGPVTAAR